MTYEASIGLDYALRAMLALSATYPQRISGPDMARDQGLPPKFLENLLGALRRAGLVQTRLGRQGGYLLTRPPASITLAEVFRAIDGPLAIVRGEPVGDLPYTGPAEHLGEVWTTVEATLRSLLESVTLMDILDGHLPQAPRSQPLAERGT